MMPLIDPGISQITPPLVPFVQYQGGKKGRRIKNSQSEKKTQINFFKIFKNHLDIRLMPIKPSSFGKV